MDISKVLTAQVYHPGHYTLCKGAGVLLGCRVVHNNAYTQTIFIKDGAKLLVTLIIPKNYPMLAVNLTKIPGREEGIPFETSLTVKLEDECELEVAYQPDGA